jgi:molecular chaperone GrpE
MAQDKRPDEQDPRPEDRPGGPDEDDRAATDPQADTPDRPPQTEPAESPEAEERPDADELFARLQRVTADYRNFQRRARKKEAEAREMANDALIKDLLGVLDDMERALAAARANHDEDDPFLTGMQMVHDNLLRTLGNYGLKPIEAAGQPFDPELHSAVQQIPSAEHPPQTVLQELQTGYRLKQRTLRPSVVVVSGPGEEEQSDQEEQ